MGFDAALTDKSSSIVLTKAEVSKFQRPVVEMREKARMGEVRWG